MELGSGHTMLLSLKATSVNSVVNHPTCSRKHRLEICFLTKPCRYLSKVSCVPIAKVETL